ncbi:unnamed protein product, partial [Coregonus sp. 'balchen']
MTINTTHNCTEPQSNWIFVGVYSMVFMVGLILNLTALVVFFCYTKSWSHTTVYMINLAIADLLLVLTLPLRIYYHLGMHGLSQVLCEGKGLSELPQVLCVFPHVLPGSGGPKESPAGLPRCVGAYHRSQPPHLHLQTQTTAVASTLTVGFGIPLVVMLVCSWALIHAITRSAVAQTDLINSGKIQRMIATSLVIFLACFLPYHGTLALLYVHREAVPCSLLSVYHYSLMVACLNAILDPLAYYFTTETFRRKVDMDAMTRMFPLNSQNSEGNNSRAPVNT